MKSTYRCSSVGAGARARCASHAGAHGAIRLPAAHRAARRRPPEQRTGDRAVRVVEDAAKRAAQFDIGLILSDDIGSFIASFDMGPAFMPPFAM